MNVKELDGLLRDKFGVSESWDRDGVQVNCGNDIKKVIVALDCTSEVLEKAIEIKADAVITHHPLIFHAISTFDISEPTEKRVFTAAKNNISVLSYHTCLDITEGGVNDSLCEKLAVRDTASFLPFARVGILDKEMAFDEFVSHCENALGVKAQNTVDCGKMCRKIAVLSGSGRSYVRDAFLTGADTFLTGEVTHDAMIDCREYGINLICNTHFATENIVMPFLAETVKSLGLEVEIYGI